jgi:hypothetical protein
LRLLKPKGGDTPPHSKDSVNLRTALILHIVDALDV